MKTNFHTHNFRCGHAQGNVQDYVDVALKNGYVELGISDHGPIPDYYPDRMNMDVFEEYLKEIEDAQKKYENKLKIYKSVEIEYFPEFHSHYEFLKGKTDYLVLGLHLFRYENSTENLSAWKIKSEKDVLAYGDYMVKAMESVFFEYIAHPDLYLINYRSWNEATKKVAHNICKTAEKLQLPLEINANGIRKTLEKHPDWDRYMYPYREFWAIASKYNVPVIIGSDAHHYQDLEDVAMDLARMFAKDLGIKVIDSIF